MARKIGFESSMGAAAAAVMGSGIRRRFYSLIFQGEIPIDDQASKEKEGEAKQSGHARSVHKKSQRMSTNAKGDFFQSWSSS